MSGRRPTRFDVDLGAKLRARRVILGLTMADAARVLGVSTTQVDKYERGVSRITVEGLVALAGRMFKCSLGELVGEAPAIADQYEITQQRWVAKLTKQASRVRVPATQEAILMIVKNVADMEEEAERGPRAEAS